MHGQDIGALLKQERGQFLEFLSAFDHRRGSASPKSGGELARQIARIISAFANADGGTLLLEFFNLTNEQNPAAVETTPGLPVDFGEPLQVLPGREGQLGVRFDFGGRR